ncbi:Glutathione S-transferase Mu 3 [Dermatophagoides pteronyssinus]|uniref:glutathione transferase n=1 Tax=Dermatophagoides pteronyssinus TaxID=6956 RepID=A0ABQ8JCP8_DERPT|nr:Glutathione S-transferase Mu 3 [Dermatophagoides pteronyssinus]
MSEKPILGYWDARGLAQSIRLLLTYAGVDFIDKRYNVGPPPNYDRSEWLNDKFNLGLDFPNCPYYIDGNVKLSQSIAILRYIARKHKLIGQNDREEIRVSLAEQQIIDMNMAIGRIAYNPNCEKLKPEFLKTLPEQVELLSKFLGDQPFIAGSNISYADFLLYEYLTKLKVLVPDVFGRFENLKKFHERIEALPRVSDYIKKQQPKSFHGPTSLWNGTYA